MSNNVFVLEGLIGVGKSTLLQQIAARFPCISIINEPLAEWRSLLEKFYADPPSYSYLLQVKILTSFRRTARDIRRQLRQTSGQIFIVERSPVSATLCFTELSRRHNFLSKEQHEELNLFYSDYFTWWENCNFIYLRTLPERALQHIQQRGRAEELVGIQLDYLQELHQIHDHVFDHGYARLTIDDCQTDQEVSVAEKADLLINHILSTVVKNRLVDNAEDYDQC